MTITRRNIVAVLTLAATLATAGLAVDRKKTNNAKSPTAESTGKVGTASVRVDYNAPSLRGRDMAKVVPAGQVWRTGADTATQLTTSGDIMIGSLKVPAGDYSLFTIPGEKEWTLIVNKQTNQWGTEYTQGQDLGRVPMKVTKANQAQEQLKIDVASGSALTIHWGNVVASAPLKPAK